MKALFYIDAKVTMDVSLKVTADSKEEAVAMAQKHLETECIIGVREKTLRSACKVEEVYGQKVEILDDSI